MNVPYPVDYGGVYDLFYKLPSLQQQGIKIHLHCFSKDREEQPELNKYCEEVYYYKRNTGRKGLSSNIPYIVSSRYNEKLLQRLLDDDHPILMEGVHCTYLTTDQRFKSRKKFVRIHNVESEYYKQLFKYTLNLKTKIYYWCEAKLLVQYEHKLAKNATTFWAVSEKDAEHYRKIFECKTIDYLPLFIPYWKVNAPEGMGTY
ncbi:MAG TPA: mannosyltransferase, partial [Parafilimonas sp.]|nr:mannosyltransferase [Parafilimonas sp.]